MQKLLIIDDEPIIREGLKGIIPWSDYGYQICDVGADGRDGLNKIRSHNPDLVLLDIRMPGFSGIELIHQVRKEKYTCKFIILTAYSSFSYAKELMGLGIESYLLKPVDEDELIKIIKKVSLDQLNEKKLQDQLALYNWMSEDESLRALLDRNLEYVSENMLKEFIDKQFQVAGISAELKHINKRWLIDQIAPNADRIKLVRKDNHYYIIFINNEESEAEKFLSTIRERLNLYGDGQIVLTLGGPVKGPEQIAASFTQAKALIDVSFCFSEKSILLYKDLEATEKEEVKPPEEINKQRLYHYLEYGDKKNAKKEILKLEEFYRSVIYSSERIKAEIIEWSISVFQIIKKNYPTLDTISKGELANNINKQANLQDIVGYLYKELSSMSNSLNGYAAITGNIIDKVKDYVNYYYHEDISLKLVADLFNYNSVYLGKVFKSQTGDFFNVYLHKVRIGNAKKLLMNKQYKVYEISKLVGYSNSDYFYKNFKLFEGISPKEYQMQYSNNTKSS